MSQTPKGIDNMFIPSDYIQEEQILLFEPWENINPNSKSPTSGQQKMTKLGQRKGHHSAALDV